MFAVASLWTCPWWVAVPGLPAAMDRTKASTAQNIRHRPHSTQNPERISSLRLPEKFAWKQIFLLIFCTVAT